MHIPRFPQFRYRCILSLALLTSCIPLSAQSDGTAVVLGFQGTVHFKSAGTVVSIERVRQQVPLNARVIIEGPGYVSLYAESHDQRLRVERTMKQSIADTLRKPPTSAVENIWKRVVRAPDESKSFEAGHPSGGKASKTRGEGSPMRIPSDSGWVAKADGDVQFTWSRCDTDAYRFVLSDDLEGHHILLDTTLSDTTVVVPLSRFPDPASEYHWIVLHRGATYATWSMFWIATPEQVDMRDAEFARLTADLDPGHQIASEAAFWYWQEQRYGYRALKAAQKIGASR